ncbi:MAG: tetratricopeptide repeat protein [SAR86 cluster bacterium]|uniref:Tetratricopeptide repeat protein n=1 Tax=SAR86 cluster bacterium TaxID=2030880 RepID=A0A520N6W2_9GAMM|nr:MAG: tetratricopeptide repeat protein [SAR86 cluster bacterium]|tara:strand:+ start:1080 stop:2486 length:1407 start_codon:yes stop_codon:yes gene_type:complete
MNKKISICLFSLLAAFFIVTPISIEAQSQTDKKPIKYKKARALQSSTAKKMAKVYEALEVVDEKGEPAPDMQIVLSILTELRNDMANLKSYDRSVMWNAWAFVYFQDGDYPKAMDAYSRLINEPEVTIGLRVQALLSLAQLNLLQENYAKGIELILQWMSEVETVTAQSYSLLGQAYYQTGNFKKALSSMETAVTMAEEEGYKPRENWYVIMAASIGEMKEEIGEKESLLRQIDIYEILVNLFPKKQYFIQLGGGYGQLGRERDYMITLKAAYQKDFLNRESEYLALTQLLLLNQNPYWAAEVFENGQKKMITIVDEKTEEEKIVPVVKDTEKNLKLLADAWRMAQEIDRAIPILEKAAKMSKDGESYVLLGNLYLSEDRLEEAASAINKGLEKGKIKKLSPVYLTLGQVYFELQEFENAKKNFRIAARDKDKKIKQQANNWIKYTENEEIRVKNLALRRDYIQMNST